jgi:nucleoside-diphosphate-sugar epimerase
MAQSAERSDSLKFTGRLLVTGGEGELGGVMGRLLHDNGVSVAVQCDSTKHRQDGLRTFPMPLLDPEFADRVRELQPEVILHCAGDARREGGSRSSYEAYCVTMDRVAALCEVVRKSAPRACVVLLSPDSATRGESPYARFARLTEDLLRECGAAFELKTTVMQCGQLFGAGLRSHVVYDILFRLHAASEGVAELPYAEAEQMELTQVFDLAAALKSLLSGEMPDVVRIEGTKIQASELTGMLARLTESRKPYEFSGRAEEIVRTTSGRLRVYPCLEQTELVEALKRFAEWWLGRR